MARTPEDFDVTEELGFEPDGVGQHVWLWVEKRAANTAAIARALRERAGVGPAAVGFSGRKDRWAVTRQWFSVDLGGRAPPSTWAGEDAPWRVIAALAHGRKLRSGTHRANRFRLRLRGIDGDRGAIEARLAAIRAHGFANAFGAQRFGRAEANLERARRDLERRSPRRPPPMALSAARAWLFNRVLDRRVAAGTWNQPLPGEALMLAGSRSVFRYDAGDADVPARVAACDVHPTGPLWGRGQQPVDPAFAQRERDWLADEARLRDGLEGVGIRAARRPLRIRPEAMAWHWTGHDLVLELALPAGAFATALLDELLERGGAWT